MKRLPLTIRLLGIFALLFIAEESCNQDNDQKLTACGKDAAGSGRNSLVEETHRSTDYPQAALEVCCIPSPTVRPSIPESKSLFPGRSSS